MAHRVLIIEDDRLASAVLTDGLRGLGWEVEAAGTAAAGLALAMSGRFDAVLTDLVLPDADGAMVVSTLRMAPGRRIPLVMMSARDGADLVAQEVGADAFHAKPARAEAVDESLRELLHRHAPAARELRHGAAIRLPRGQPAARAGKRLAAGWLPAALLKLHDARFTGVLEAESEGRRLKLFLQRGAPAAARCSEAGTELGKILERMGVVVPGNLDAVAAEARLAHRPLAEELVETACLSRSVAEQALREQIIARAEVANAWTSGTWSAVEADAVGLAGFEVPAGVVVCRLGGLPEAESLPESGGARLHLSAEVFGLLGDSLWEVHAAAARGAGAAELRSLGGAAGERTLRTLRRFGLLSFGAGIESAPADLQQLAEFEASLLSQHRALADADHYTVLGLSPAAESPEVQAAAAAAADRWRPERLPAGLSSASRDRARQLLARVVEAERVLGDAQRRAVYDGVLARSESFLVGTIEPEAGPLLQAERARRALERGEAVTAAALFRCAVSVAGEDPDLLAMLARARRLACPADLAAGEDMLHRALALDPEAEYALYCLGLQHAEQGAVADARRCFRRALLRNPEFEPARDALRSLPT